MRNIILLYHDGSIEELSILEIFQNNLHYHTHVKTIQYALIPLYENGHSFIPIKPDILYSFDSAAIDIRYDTLQWIDHDDTYDHFRSIYSKKHTSDVIEFINLIYQAYRFVIYGDMYNLAFVDTYILTYTFINSISLTIYNRDGDVIYDIFNDDGMIYAIDGDQQSLANQTIARCEFLKDFMYIGDFGLPSLVFDGPFRYRRVTKKIYDLDSDDMLLYYVANLGVYYAINKKDFLGRISRTKRIQAFYMSIEGDTPGTNFEELLKTNEIPIDILIETITSTINHGSYYGCAIELVNIDDEIAIELFGNNIMHHHAYLYEHNSILTIFALTYSRIEHTRYNFEHDIMEMLANSFLQKKLYLADTHTGVLASDINIVKYMYRYLGDGDEYVHQFYERKE